MFVCLFFFFKQKTAYEMRISDWSSDVCSSDLQSRCRGGQAPESLRYERQIAVAPIGHAQQHHDDDGHENEPGESRRTAGEAGKAGADADGEVDDVGARQKLRDAQQLGELERREPALLPAHHAPGEWQDAAEARKD